MSNKLKLKNNLTFKAVIYSADAENPSLPYGKFQFSTKIPKGQTPRDVIFDVAAGAFSKVSNGTAVIIETCNYKEFEKNVFVPVSKMTEDGYVELARMKLEDVAEKFIIN